MNNMIAITAMLMPIQSRFDQPVVEADQLNRRSGNMSGPTGNSMPRQLGGRVARIVTG